MRLEDVLRNMLDSIPIGAGVGTVFALTHSWIAMSVVFGVGVASLSIGYWRGLTRDSR